MSDIKKDLNSDQAEFIEDLETIYQGPQPTSYKKMIYTTKGNISAINWEEGNLTTLPESLGNLVGFTEKEAASGFLRINTSFI